MPPSRRRMRPRSDIRLDAALASSSIVHLSCARCSHAPPPRSTPSATAAASTSAFASLAHRACSVAVVVGIGFEAPRCGGRDASARRRRRATAQNTKVDAATPPYTRAPRRRTSSVDGQRAATTRCHDLHVDGRRRRRHPGGCRRCGLDSCAGHGAAADGGSYRPRTSIEVFDIVAEYRSR